MDTNLPGTTGVPIIAGNFPDPDARVLDSLIESQAEPAKLTPAAPTLPHVRTEPMTRLMTGTIAMQPLWPAYPLVPADSRRTGLRIRVSSATAPDAIRLSDDAGKVQTFGGSALIYAGDTYFSEAQHTGPVWVSCPDAIGPVIVSFIAVTK